MKVKFDGTKVQSLRMEKNITQTRLAELSGTTVRYIRALETGKRTNPSAVVLYRIGQALGKPMDAFMVPNTEEKKHDRH